jgi:RNA recognition motif-containing protein
MSVRLFVGNLTYDVTEADLKELFSPAGPLLQVRIPIDRETGKPKGIAFVDFSERSQADDAIRRFHQQLFKGRPLVVNEARAIDDRPPPRTNAQPRSDWSGLPPAPDEEGERPGQPRRKFGPDAKGSKFKQAAFKSKGERGPKGPIRERSGGQLYFNPDEDDADDTEAVDIWAKGAETEGEEE